MIYVTRDPTVPSVRVFTERRGKKKVTAAERDLEQATHYFGDPKNFAGGKRKTSKKPPVFNAYRDKDLVAALDAIFHRKCAYCESTFAAVSNSDVEHFRPKSAIDTGVDEIQPGYYWLVADWNNLLLSCQHCNRRQYHLSPGSGKKIKMGKGTQFPLSDESRRVRRPGGISGEEDYRLLVHPCLDKDAAEHFRFDAEGLVHARTPQGETSIWVYALQRQELVHWRVEEAHDLTLQFATIRDAARDLGAALAIKDAATIERREHQLGRELDRLRDRLKPEARYLAMKRQLIRAAVDAGELDDLRRVGAELDLLKV